MKMHGNVLLPKSEHRQTAAARANARNGMPDKHKQRAQSVVNNAGHAVDYATWNVATVLPYTEPARKLPANGVVSNPAVTKEWTTAKRWYKYDTLGLWGK